MVLEPLFRQVTTLEVSSEAPSKPFLVWLDIFSCAINPKNTLGVSVLCYLDNVPYPPHLFLFFLTWHCMPLVGGLETIVGPEIGFAMRYTMGGTTVTWWDIRLGITQRWHDTLTLGGSISPPQYICNHQKTWKSFKINTKHRKSSRIYDIVKQMSQIPDSSFEETFGHIFPN